VVGTGLQSNLFFQLINQVGCNDNGGLPIKDEYINDLIEWMEHQYDPGYWTNHMPPHIKYAKKPITPNRFIIKYNNNYFFFILYF